jgi:hypothetical protein
MLKCQVCGENATNHVTEIVAGEPVEYHLCETHVSKLDSLASVPGAKKPVGGPSAFWRDAALQQAMQDPTSREKVAAYFLPALCMALLDEKPEVRIMAIFRLLCLGPHAQSALAALRDTQQDSDERVRQAGKIAVEHLGSGPEASWFF